MIAEGGSCVGDLVTAEILGAGPVRNFTGRKDIRKRGPISNGAGTITLIYVTDPEGNIIPACQLSGRELQKWG